jgi:hypothetical protein
MSITGSIHFPYLLNITPQRALSETQAMIRVKSDGSLDKKLNQSFMATSTMSGRTGDSLRRMIKETGLPQRRIEGGVRPNMEEPMKFFKKLFNQPQEGGAAGFSTMLSPPDRPYNHCKLLSFFFHGL